MECTFESLRLSAHAILAPCGTNRRQFISHDKITSNTVKMSIGGLTRRDPAMHKCDVQDADTETPRSVCLLSVGPPPPR